MSYSFHSIVFVSLWQWWNHNASWCEDKAFLSWTIFVFYLHYKAHNAPHFSGSFVVVIAMYSGFLLQCAWYSGYIIQVAWLSQELQTTCTLSHSWKLGVSFMFTVKFWMKWSVAIHMWQWCSYDPTFCSRR
jgi:hypothetical protein